MKRVRRYQWRRFDSLLGDAACEEGFAAGCGRSTATDAHPATAAGWAASARRDWMLAEARVAGPVPLSSAPREAQVGQRDRLAATSAPQFEHRRPTIRGSSESYRSVDCDRVTKKAVIPGRGKNKKPAANGPVSPLAPRCPGDQIQTAVHCIRCSRVRRLLFEASASLPPVYERGCQMRHWPWSWLGKYFRPFGMRHTSQDFRLVLA
jgi:hypothetical protein